MDESTPLPRKLSSNLTFVKKVVVPIWILGFLALFDGWVLTQFITAILAPDYARNPPPIGAIIFYLSVSILIVAWICWSLIPLKVVSIDDESIYVDNYWRQFRVPLTEVTDVYERPFDREHPTVIRLQRDHGFGRKIVFLPKSKPGLLGGALLAADIIREAVAQARQKTAASV